MIILAIVALWYAIGVAGVACVIYTDDRSFRILRTTELETGLAAVASLLGPLWLLYAGTRLVFHAVDAARVRKDQRIAELEKELAAARREVDVYLKAGASR